MAFALTISASGASIGSIPNETNTRGDRASITGWSKASARSNLRFLQSICLEKIGASWAATLTVGRDVPSFEVWARIRRNFLNWLRMHINPRSYYWLMEFQRRGAPHLHVWAVVDLDNPKHIDLLAIVNHWVHLVAATGAKDRGQHIEPIDPRIAWARYLAKHMARGRSHYQRAVLPEGWKVTGRVWGRSGDWPVMVHRVEVPNEAAYKMRRIFRRYVGKHHAAAGAGVNGKANSSVRGASVWLSNASTKRALQWATENHEIVTADGEVIAEGAPEMGVWLGGCLVPGRRYRGVK